MIALYVLFALSVFCPVYTYALYPIVLRMMRGKQYKNEEIEPDVSVVVVGKNVEEKVTNDCQCGYPNANVIVGDYANKTKGDIIVFTDTKTQIDLSAIREIIKPFADQRVGCVVGQQTNPEGNSAFWKYENKIKELESRIGCVSGAPESLFAVRKSDMPRIPESVLNKPFYIATKITENGKAVLYQETAKAYEGKTDGTYFRKHVEDARGYWQALKLFPKMLIGRHGSFVYISHRVMKWFVWLNMVTMLVTSGLLGFNGSAFMATLFYLQVVGYFLLLLLGRKNIRGPVGKIIGIGYYFVMLNMSYLVGFFR